MTSHPTLLSHFQDAIAKQVIQMAESKNHEVFMQLVKAFCASDTSFSETLQVVFCAVGKSAGIAQLVVSMLHSVGIRSRFLHPTEALHGDLGMVQKNDVVVCISNGGRSPEVLQLIPFLQKRTNEIFCLTSQAQSPLALQAKYLCLLPQVDEGCPLGQAPLTSTVTSLCYLQAAVAETLKQREMNLRRYAENHPGGSIGKRIFVKVENTMIPRNRLAVIFEHSTFIECISALTKSSSAGICVVSQDNKLAGLVSEKDLRVAMEKHKQKTFELIVKDFMNSTPKTIASHVLAADALAEMETGTRVLNVLPVVNPVTFELEGMLRLVDLHREQILK